MQRSCESCIHTDVCKYKAEYKELLKEKQAITKKNNEDIFEAIINCKYYKTNEVIYKKNSYRVTYTDDSITTSTSKSVDTATSTYTLN